jgi:hypothetical protein
MYLTREEEKILDGEHGWAEQICMRILVKLGDLFGATKLIPVNSAHVSGVSYKTLGEAPIQFLQALAENNAKAKVKATLNPSSIDKKIFGNKIPREFYAKQATILELFQKMHVKPVLTCTPYYIEKPKLNTHLAWSESSAVIYANSILGSWTNREGSPSALAAAIIGKTPNYGIHQPENREATTLVQIEAKLESEVDYGVLGILVGKKLQGGTPLFQGINASEKDCLKQLGAALASTSNINMFCYGQKPKEKIEKITITKKELEHTTENLSTAGSEATPDLVFIGCPHCSLDEIRHIAKLVKGRKVKKHVQLWICASRYVKQKTKTQIEAIEKTGAKVLSDTCAVVTWTRLMGINTIMTNSAKTAYYAPTLNKAQTILAPLEKCLKTALIP